MGMTDDDYDALALKYYRRGDFSTSLKYTRHALKLRTSLLGEVHPKTADSYHLLGVTLHSVGDFASALPSDKRALEIRRKLFGEEHLKTAESYYSVGVTQHSLGDFLSALESGTRALNIRLKILGNKHWETAESHYSVGATHSSLGDVIAAYESNRRALEISLKLLEGDLTKDDSSIRPTQLVSTANNYYSLGIIQHSQGDFSSALESTKRSLEIRLKLYGEHHSKTADSYYSLGVTQFLMGNVQLALSSNERALKIRQRLFGEDHPKVADCFYLVGLIQKDKGQFFFALNSSNSSLSIRRKVLGEEHPKTVDSYYLLGVIQHYLQDFVAVVESKETSSEIRERLLGKKCPKTAESSFSLGVRQNRLKDGALESKKSASDIGLQQSGGAQQNSGPRFLASQVHYTNGEAVKTIDYRGGFIVLNGVQLVCPCGAIGRTDDSVSIKMALEEPSTHCDMIVTNGLENDVMFIAPVIDLQPNGYVFNKPVFVTIKLDIDNGSDSSPDDVLTLHGTEAGGGKIIWENVTSKSNLDMEKKELKVEIKTFSRIATFLRVTSILAKHVVTRVNLLGFSYTLTMLFKDNHPRPPFAELALAFMSHDVYHEKCYREDPSSVLVKLKGDGFEEFSSIDKPESKLIYNSEILKVSVILGEDYMLNGGQNESRNLNVESSVWWSTGHVIKLSLKSIKETKILCGKVVVEGRHGHRLTAAFCELDRGGFVRRLLRVGGSILNLLPITQKLELPNEVVHEAIQCWLDDDEQLKMILQHWSMEQCDRGNDELITLRDVLQELNPEDVEVDERGKMHINHLRELACDIHGLKRSDHHLKEYFTKEIVILCNSILKDCCIEMDADAYTENCPRFLFFHKRVTEDVAIKLEQICSFSSRSIEKDFLYAVPFLIQAVKEIFRQSEDEVMQNGLKGLRTEIIEQHEAGVLKAFQNEDILRLMCEVCKVFQNLCLNNCEKHSCELIESWSDSLGIWNMSEFLKAFFQSRQENKLFKRIQLFSRSLKRFSEDIRSVKKQEMRFFYNVSQSLIRFATFDPRKLVRFEMTFSDSSPVKCYSGALKYDKPQDTYHQHFGIEKEHEGELQLGTVANVHLDGKIRQVGAFKCVVLLPSSIATDLNSWPIPVARVKIELTDFGSKRLVLYSTRRESISEALRLLQKKFGDDELRAQAAEITSCHLDVRCTTEALGVMRLKLLYKWRSEAISVDSNDFVAIAETAAKDCTTQAGAEIALPSTARSPYDQDGNFLIDPSTTEIINRYARQTFGPVEVHLHQTIQKGHVCVTGNNTSLCVKMPETHQSLAQSGLCAPSQNPQIQGQTWNETTASGHGDDNTDPND